MNYKLDVLYAIRGVNKISKQIIVGGIILLFICSVLSGCNGGQAISADELDAIPENFVTISEEEMENYPTLEEAIYTEGLIDIPGKEFNEILEFLDRIWFMENTMN